MKAIWSKGQVSRNVRLGQNRAELQLCEHYFHSPFTQVIEMEWMGGLNSLETLSEMPSLAHFETFPLGYINMASYFFRGWCTWAAISSTGQVCH